MNLYENSSKIVCERPMPKAHQAMVQTYVKITRLILTSDSRASRINTEIIFTDFT